MTKESGVHIRQMRWKRTGEEHRRITVKRRRRNRWENLLHRDKQTTVHRLGASGSSIDLSTNTLILFSRVIQKYI